VSGAGGKGGGGGTVGAGGVSGAGGKGGVGGTGGSGTAGRSTAMDAGGDAAGGAGGSRGTVDTLVCPGETKGTWVAMSTTSAPRGTDRPTLLWTGTELFIDSYGQAGLFDPCANTWRTSPQPQGSLVSSLPVANRFLFLWPQHSFEAFDYRQNQVLPLSLAGASQASYATVVPTGAKLLEWGGAIVTSAPDAGSRLVGTQTGAIYDPATDAWTAMSTKGAPAGRVAPAAWTGSQLAIWGGHSADTSWTDAGVIECTGSYVNKAWGCLQYGDGALYDPARDVWTPMAATGAPKPRFDHLLVWTGDRVLVWGGGEQGLPDSTLGSSGEQRLNDGGLYDPVAQTWTAVAPLPASPLIDTRGMLWTGDFLAGFGSINEVWGLFDPHSNSWSIMDPITTDPLAGCVKSMTVQAGALVGGICDIDSVLTVVLRPAGEQAWRFYPLPSDVLRDANVLWTGKRLFVWGGKIPSTYTCPPPSVHPGCDPPPPTYSNAGYMLVP
jgi:hypothetical protein